MGVAARERVIAHFTIDKFIRNYEVAYEFTAQAAVSEAPNYSNSLLKSAMNK
jgi:hypothetical protein